MHRLSAGGTAWERIFHFKQPMGDWRAAFENVRAWLLSDPPALAAPLDELALSLTETDGESGYQVDMLDAKRADKRRRGSDSQSVLCRAVAPLPEMRAVKAPLDA